MIVPAVNVRSKPATLSWERAAASGLVTSSALRLLRRARFDPATTCWSSASAAARRRPRCCWRALGAKQVWVTSRDAAKLRWAAHHGATGGSRTSDPFDEQVRETTDGRGVDIVVENVGTLTLDRSLRSSRVAAASS